MASTTSSGMPSVRQQTLVAPPGRQVSGVSEPRQAVGRLVHGAVAAERHHHVVALGGRLAADLGGVVGLLGVHGLDRVARLERVDHEVPEPVRDRGRVRVHDHEHPLLGRAVGEQALRQLLGALDGVVSRVATSDCYPGRAARLRAPRSAPRRRRSTSRTRPSSEQDVGVAQHLARGSGRPGSRRCCPTAPAPARRRCAAARRSARAASPRGAGGARSARRSASGGR